MTSASYHDYEASAFPTDAVSTWHELRQNFEDYVAGLELERLAVRKNEQQTLIRPEAFGFIALAPFPGREMASNLLAATKIHEATLKYMHPDISYWGPGGSMWMDTKQAVGLTYDRKLIAIGGAGIDFDGRVMVKQLQDVTGVRKDEVSEDKFTSTGLHNGFMWRHTLVRAWEQIGFELGASEIVVQSFKRNEWRKDINDPTRGYAAYDLVAKQLGFTDGNIPYQAENWSRMITPTYAQLVLRRSNAA